MQSMTWLPWASCFAAILLINHKLKQQPTEEEEEKEEEEEERVAVVLALTEPFPWEPSLPKESSSTSSQRRDTSNHLPAIITSDNAEEQLQFLAGMTFANGNLREPCPCCR